MLISGQPQESYPNYPLWLKRKDDNVKRLDVPGIERGDILSLVTQKISDTRRSEYNAITDIVEKYSEKNTLAAIFAVYEASQCADAMELERKLSDRKLSGNIEEYYSNIWNDAVGTLKQYDFVDYKLAGVFAFLNERVDGQMLAEIFNELDIPVVAWNNVLKTLKPLIVEESGKYHVLHNDVKVFLSNIVNIDDEHTREIGNSLTDYYLYKEDKSQAYYFDIVRLMSMAKREAEIVDVFSGKFVIEAYVNGVELFELTSISNNIMKRLFLQKVIDYDKLQSLSTAILTIDKLEDTKYEIENSEFRDARQYVGVAPYECYVEPINQWDVHLISDVLSYARVLYYSGKKERAVDLFNRWFEGLTVLNLWAVLKDKGMLDTRNQDYIMISTEAKEISDDLGKLICWSKQYSMLEKESEWNDEITVFMRGLCESFWHESVLNYKDKELETALISISHIAVRPNVLIDILIELIEELKFSSISIIEKVNRDVLVHSKLGLIFDLFMRIVSGNIEKYDKYEREEVYNKIQGIELPHGDFEHEIYYYSIYAVVVSYLQPAVDRLIVSQRVLDKFLTKNSHRDRGYYGVWFNCLCYLGYWLHAKHNGQKFAEHLCEMERILSLVMIKEWFPRVTDLQIRNISSLILKAYIILATQESEAYKSAISNICEKIFENNPIHQVMDAGWYFYRDNVERLTAWYQDWLGEKGRVWDNPIGERNRIIKDILNLVEKYQLENYIDTTAVREKAKWSVIGYASHKEYSLSDAVKLGYKYCNALFELKNHPKDLVYWRMKVLDSLYCNIDLISGDSELLALYKLTNSWIKVNIENDREYNRLETLKSYNYEIISRISSPEIREKLMAKGLYDKAEQKDFSVETGRNYNLEIINLLKEDGYNEKAEGVILTQIEKREIGLHKLIMEAGDIIAPKHMEEYVNRCVVKFILSESKYGYIGSGISDVFERYYEMFNDDTWILLFENIVTRFAESDYGTIASLWGDFTIFSIHYLSRRDKDKIKALFDCLCKTHESLSSANGRVKIKEEKLILDENITSLSDMVNFQLNI